MYMEIQDARGEKRDWQRPGGQRNAYRAYVRRPTLSPDRACIQAVVFSNPGCTLESREDLSETDTEFPLNENPWGEAQAAISLTIPLCNWG